MGTMFSFIAIPIMFLVTAGIVVLLISLAVLIVRLVKHYSK